MIISDSTLNAAIFVTTAYGFIKTAFAGTIVEGVLGILTLCMAGGLGFIADQRHRVMSPKQLEQ